MSSAEWQRDGVHVRKHLEAAVGEKWHLKKAVAEMKANGWPHWRQSDAKSAFAQRIAARWHLNDLSTPRFLCGHLEEINLRHLMPGEHFPYGASGMHFLECMICPKEPEPVKPRKRKDKKAGKR